jgi:hypothetical protein
VLSVVAQQLLTIQNALRANLDKFWFEGRPIKLQQTCGVFSEYMHGHAWEPSPHIESHSVESHTRITKLWHADEHASVSKHPAAQSKRQIWEVKTSARSIQTTQYSSRWAALQAMKVLTGLSIAVFPCLLQSQ